MVRKKLNCNKNNNKGFTLIEVLVGIIILTIMSAPIFRAFATSAQTNARAIIKAKCTTAAENLMEDYRSLSADDLEEKIKEYEDLADPSIVAAPDKCAVTSCKADMGGSLICPSCGAINLLVRSNDEMRSDLPDGYYGRVVLNPKSYEKTNSLNVAEFGAVSPQSGAIYTSEKVMDDAAVDAFLRRNHEYCSSHAGGKEYYRIDSETGELLEDSSRTIRKKLVKNVTFEIDEISKYTDKNGDEISLAKVNMEIVYKLEGTDAANVVAVDKREYQAEKAFLFDNTASKRKLDGIYYFFEQRDGVESPNKENIIFLNPDNVETNIYVVAVNAPENDYLDRVSVLIKEKTVGDDGKASTKLRTNLLVTNSLSNLRTPYDKTDTRTYTTRGSITYATQGSSYSGDAAIDMLSIADIDGKRLRSEDQETRIFKVKISIYDDDDNEVAYLDGSKLNK